MTNFEKVGKFMETFGQEVKSKSSFSSEKINSLRVSLIEEELEELKEAIKNKNHYSTRVFNYGATSVNVKQQLERFNRDIKVRKKDVVIFYDGVNDVIQGVYHGNPDGWIVGNNRKTHYLIRLLRKYKKLYFLS